MVSFLPPAKLQGWHRLMELVPLKHGNLRLCAFLKNGSSFNTIRLLDYQHFDFSIAVLLGRNMRHGVCLAVVSQGLISPYGLKLEAFDILDEPVVVQPALSLLLHQN